MDYNSSFFGSDRDLGVPADSRNMAAEYGRSDFDVRHRVVVSYIYELPFGRGRALGGGVNGVLNQVIGGWQISGITEYRTGFPFTIFAGTSTDYSGFNQFADRIDFRPGVTSLPQNNDDPDKAFDTSVLTTPSAGSIGNTRRNDFTGPAFLNWDFAVFKDFPVTEGRRFQFRAEAFNVFNHTNFRLPQSNRDGSGFGTIQRAYDPRLIQLGLRFDW